MLFLSEKEAVNWCLRNQITLDDRKLPEFSPNLHLQQFDIPPDAGQRVALVKSQVERFRDDGEILIWITDWSVWESGERLHIFYKFRQSYGENRLLIDIPVHVISKDEFEDGLSIITLAVLFLWDCYVLSKAGEKFLFYSHDEFGLTNE